MTAAPQAPVVCILDSGTNEAGAEGWNYLAGNEDLTDEAGHGDLIYQLLESETPNARLIMLKCFESAEETEEKKGTETITQALYDAVDLWQADVISISWTRNEESEELYEAVCYARENGAVLVAAAGNLSLSTPLGSLVYPAAWEEVIGVGGADTDEKGEPVALSGILRARRYLSVQMEIMKGKRVPLLQSPGFQEKSQNISFKSRKPPKQKFGNG